VLACVDVDYRDTYAVAACILFRDWNDATVAESRTAVVPLVEPYVPGQFYRRELPCVLAILRAVATPIETIVIDGYVWLDAGGRPGLGARLFDELDRKVPVIGAAKSAFRGSSPIEVRRGRSDRPLYVTSAGIPPAEAADCIRRMHGDSRVPTLLKQVDRLCRSFVPSR
jgi:deoxyribonuclease V